MLYSVQYSTVNHACYRLKTELADFGRFCPEKLVRFLADRTNGRAIATLLRLSFVVCLSVTLCIVAKRCVLEQKSYYGEPIGSRI